MKYKVMIVDAGGRAAVLASKYLESKFVAEVVVVPGNDLIAYMHKRAKVYPNVKVTNVESIKKIAKRQKIDLIDVAQDDAIAVGVVDTLIEAGFKVLGPTKAAGQIEWDKSWSKNFMKKAKIPTASYRIFNSQKEATAYIKHQKDSQWYIKASGLAAGKGALHAKNKQEAQDKIKELSNFGKAADVFVIEQMLFGEEFSAFAICDGQNFQILGYAQDHKTVYNSDEGPNTGGMGCASPPLAITKDIEKQTSIIFKKAVNGLKAIKRPYVGILYLGGIIDRRGHVWAIEFNARWGDPEAQVLIPSIKNDFYTLSSAAIGGKINSVKLRRDNRYRVVVTAASKGYPQDYSQSFGCEIFGIPKVLKAKITVFGAGVNIKNKKFTAGGGRLFYILGEGQDVIMARKMAYGALAQIYAGGNNLHYRTDIAYRDLARMYKKS